MRNKISHVYFIILISVNLNLLAQATSQMYVLGSAEFMPNEIISNNIRDTNGEVCAGIMIVSDLEGLTYQSNNGIVDKQSQPGKDLLYVSPSERVIEVYKFGYEPLRIILSDLSINLKSGQVWQTKITGDKKLDLIPVNILTNPTDATIIIDGKTEPISKNYQLSEGLHELIVEKTGYRTFLKSIDVKTTNNFFEISLEKVDIIMVIIKSVPTDATIFVDNVDQGKTDKAIFLMPGNYSLKLSKSGYLDHQENLTINENTPNELSFNINQNIGTLSLDITPNVSNIKLNNGTRTISGKASISLAPGTYKLEIEEPGYRNVTDYIEIKLAETTLMKYNLIPITGKLQLSIKPLKANVRLSKNGKTIQNFTGPKLLNNLLVGEYTLYISLTGYETISENITLTENNITAIDYSLLAVKSTKQIRLYSSPRNNYYVMIPVKLKKDLTYNPPTLASLPQFGKVTLLGEKDDQYYVSYNGIKGFIGKVWVKKK
jgi:PEGA domain